MKLPQEWHVYMLLCDNKKYYIGITPNVQKRLLEHRNKLSLANKEFSDIKLVYCERYKDKYLAAKREVRADSFCEDCQIFFCIFCPLDTTV